MTNSEAIERLRAFCKLRAFCELYPDACQKDKCEIYMAIEALSNSQKQSDSEVKIKTDSVSESDVIYRQDAIDAIDKHIDTFDAIDTNYFCGLRTAMSFLKKMPSAQHKSLCNTCRYINLEWYEEPCDSCTMGGESNHYKPSAQRTGEWIHDGSDWTNRWICSKCGYKHFLEKTNYCPNCGADMRGEANGN